MQKNTTFRIIAEILNEIVKMRDQIKKRVVVSILNQHHKTLKVFTGFIFEREP